MSITSIINDLIGGRANGASATSHDSDSVKDLFKNNNVDPFEKHSKKMANRLEFNEITDRFQLKGAGTNPTGKLANLNEVVGNLEQDKEIKSIIEDLHEVTGGPTKAEIRADASKVKKLARASDKIFTGMQKEVSAHLEAIEVLNKEFSDVSKKVNESFAKQRTALQEATGAQFSVGGWSFNIGTPEAKQNALKSLNENQMEVISHLKSEMKNRLEVHETVVSELKGLSKEIEEVAGVTNKHGFGKAGSALAHDATAIEKAGGAAAKSEAKVLKAGTGASLGIVAGTTAIGGVIGHQFDKDGSQTGTWIGALTGGVTGFVAKNNIAKMLNIASHAR